MLGLVVLGLVVEDLSHGCCHATRQDALLIIRKVFGLACFIDVVEQHATIRTRLVPLCCHQLIDGCLSLAARTLLDISTAERANLVGIHLQPEAHVAGHVVRIEGTTLDVAKDFFSAVVTRDDDEAIVASYVEHVQGFTEGLSLGELRSTQGSGTACVAGMDSLLLQEGCGLLLSRLTIYGTCPGSSAHCAQSANDTDNIFLHDVSPPKCYDC